MYSMACYLIPWYYAYGLSVHVCVCVRCARVFDNVFGYFLFAPLHSIIVPARSQDLKLRGRGLISS